MSANFNFAIRLLGQVQLGVGATVIYQAPSYPSNVQARVNAIWIANTDTVAHTVTLRAGVGTLTAANSLGEGWTIPANTTLLISGSEWILTLGKDMKLEGFADTGAKVTVTASGDESN